MLRPVALALELDALGAAFVVVGSTAAMLRGCDVRPADLDVVVEPADASAFVAAVRSLGGGLSDAQLRRCRDVHVDTAWGPLDVFVAACPVDAVQHLGEQYLRVAT
jgi:hypothetical protein